MSKIVGRAIAFAATLIVTTGADANGGPTPYWALPWYSPNGPSAIETRSTFDGENRHVQSRADIVHGRSHLNHRHLPTLELDDRNSAMSHQYLAETPPRWEASDRILPNANECAPDKAEPVWGGGPLPMGYSCVTPSAN